VDVKDNLDKALRALKNRMSREGVLQELKKRRFFEKPSVKRKRKIREAQKRLRRSLKRQG
jgi:small subunit ribosomal protein S21